MANRMFDLSEKHIQLIDVLYRWSLEPVGENCGFHFRPEVQEAMHVEDAEAGSLLQIAKHLGVFSDCEERDGFPYAFRPHPALIAQIQGQIQKNLKEQAESKRFELVESKQEKVGGNWWTARPLMVLLVATLIVTFLNQLASLIKIVIESLNL